MTLKYQNDRELAEMIAKFRTPPGLSWEDLANDIEAVLSARREWGWDHLETSKELH